MNSKHYIINMGTFVKLTVLTCRLPNFTTDFYLEIFNFIDEIQFSVELFII